MNTGSGLKMEPLNFLMTMHKDEVCMHFLSALAEQMVTSAPRLAAYPGGSPPLLHIPVAPCNSAFISVRTVQVYPPLFGHYRRSMFVYQTKTSTVRLNFRLYVAK